MEEVRSPEQEAAEDIFFGQEVIIWARWFLILAATILVLWTISDPAQLAFTMVPLVGLILMNFFLYGRYLMQQPANRNLVILTSLIDLVIVTALVLWWPGARGLNSALFVLYYPIVLALGFVFPRRIQAFYTGLAVVGYAAACLLADTAFLADAAEVKKLVLRLVTLAAMGGLANYYWRIQRARRRALGGAPAPEQLGAGA